jgi:hypothetical protein
VYCRSYHIVSSFFKKKIECTHTTNATQLKKKRKKTWSTHRDKTDTRSVKRGGAKKRRAKKGGGQPERLGQFE